MYEEPAPQNALKADRIYRIVKAENFNDNRHSNHYLWVVYIDNDHNKPYLFKTLGKACEWIANFSEQEI